MLPSDVGDRRHNISFDETAYDQVVLGDLLGFFAQRWDLSVTLVQVERGHLVHVSQAAHSHGSP